MSKKQFIYSLIIVVFVFILVIEEFFIPTQKQQRGIKMKEGTNNFYTAFKERIEKSQPMSKPKNNIHYSRRNKTSIKSQYQCENPKPEDAEKDKTDSAVNETNGMLSNDIKTDMEDKIHKKESRPLIREIPHQIIMQGERFQSIALKEFIIDSLNSSNEIKWCIKEAGKLIYNIDSGNYLNIELPDRNWQGIDTLRLTAANNSNLSETIIVVFEVREIDLLNRYPYKPIKDVLIVGVEDIMSLVINPVSWDSQDILNAASIILGTAMLTTGDKEIQKHVIQQKNYKNNSIVKFGKFYGESATSQIAGLGLSIYGIAAKDKQITKLGLEVFESYLITDRIVFLLKHIWGRERPSAGKGNMAFNPFTSRSNDDNSLPSGHAALAFSLSTVLSSYIDNSYLKILMYVPAVVTLSSRVMQNYHWTSDVFLGGALGYVIGDFLTSRHNKMSADKISFSVDGFGRIGLIYKF